MWRCSGVKCVSEGNFSPGWTSYGGVNSLGARLSTMCRSEVGIRGPWTAKVLRRRSLLSEGRSAGWTGAVASPSVARQAKVTLYVDCVSESLSGFVCIINVCMLLSLFMWVCYELQLCLAQMTSINWKGSEISLCFNASVWEKDW